MMVLMQENWHIVRGLRLHILALMSGFHLLMQVKPRSEKACKGWAVCCALTGSSLRPSLYIQACIIHRVRINQQAYMLWLDQFHTPADLLLPVSFHTCFLLCLAHVQVHVANILLSSVQRQLLYSVRIVLTHESVYQTSLRYVCNLSACCTEHV